MTAQTSLDAQLETGNSPFADFTQFPDSDVSHFNKFLLLMVDIPANDYFSLSIRLITLCRLHEISHNHWKMMIVCSFHHDQLLHHFNHHSVRVHSKCIESQRHVNQSRHPIRWPTKAYSWTHHIHTESQISIKPIVKI